MTSGTVRMLTSTTRPKEVIIATRMRPQRDAGVQVRFNVSQVDEWASKGKIRSGDTLHRAIRRRERDALPRLDGIAFISDFVGGKCPAAFSMRSGFQRWLSRVLSRKQINQILPHRGTI